MVHFKEAKMLSHIESENEMTGIDVQTKVFLMVQTIFGWRCENFRKAGPFT